ncbi:MAG: FISUMP domain-containing protein [Bacteroidales bacterium]|nr:FISUMP domain-containing protein [Bacteroidales bacterium]
MKKGLSILSIMCLLAVAGAFHGCKKATVPELTTVDVTQITLNSAVSGGTIKSDGGEDITEKGVCWSTTTGPTIADSKTSDGKGSANFTSNLVGLAEGQPYYVRAYATNSVGTAYGNEVTFTTAQVTGAALTTTEATAITPSSATAGGNVTDAGGGTVSARGVCWGTAEHPTIIADSKTTNGTGTGSFTSSLTGLANGTVYYYRAYATNSSGTTYGQEYHFITPVADIEGNVYQTVKIGTQVWMAENLKTTKYNDDAAIPTVTENADWIALTTDAYCWAQNNETTYKPLYGALYNWYAVETGKLCPTGWHMPTDAEFITMEVSLGMTQVDASGTEFRGTDQGKQMKSTTGWAEGENGTNTSGFTALPAGYRAYGTGISEGLGLITYWWTATMTDQDIAVYRRLDGDSDQVYRLGTYKRAGKSVRCVKD